jgi:hypothetical protein
MTGHCPGIDPFIPAYGAGETARDADLPRSANPHRDHKESRQHRGWDSGWLARDSRLAERLVCNAALEAIGHG